MKTYGRYFKSHADPKNSPAHDKVSAKVSEPVRTLFAQGTHGTKRVRAIR